VKSVHLHEPAWSCLHSVAAWLGLRVSRQASQRSPLAITTRTSDIRAKLGLSELPLMKLK